MPQSSSARQMMMKKSKMPSKKEMTKHMSVEKAMEEVHKDIPENVKKTGKKGKAKEAMLRAIAFSKAGKSKKK